MWIKLHVENVAHSQSRMMVNETSYCRLHRVHTHTLNNLFSSHLITGKVYAWGMGSNNQLGVGSEDDQETPTQLTGKQVLDKNVLRVSSGGQHTLFIVKD